MLYGKWKIDSFSFTHRYMIIQLPGIFENLFTNSDASDLVAILDKAKSELFTSADSLQNFSENLPINIYQAIVEFAKEQKLTLASPNDLEIIIDKIREEILNLPVLNLQIAVVPTPKNVMNISRWLSAQIGKKILLTIEINHDLVAGAALEFEGFYKDYTFKTKMEDYLKKTKLRDFIRE